MVFEFVLRSLPTSPNAETGIDPLGRVKWPVINDLGVALVLLEGLTIDKELDVWEDDGDGVMMPLIVTHLYRTDRKQISFSSFTTQFKVSLIKPESH